MASTLARTVFVPTQPLAVAEERLRGRSPAMQRVRADIVRSAACDASALILGPSGTGKEVAARLLHDLSARCEGPFVALDCGALAEGVLESELFGHERGSFSGAAAQRRGLIESAHRGTLFLDEIGNTSLGVQARLLRVLEEREVRRVGGNHDTQVDVRIVAATNRDLARDVAAGTFRADLLWRLDVLTVRMPALADRPEDVLDIADRILADIARPGRPQLALSEGALTVLLSHSWPGNVRELRNALERASAFADGPIIDVEDLPERLSAPVRDGAESACKLQGMIDEFERAVLFARLQRHGWRKRRAAEELGITRRTLRNKLVKHGITPPPRPAFMA